ncbi:hypothetical protein NKJ06_14720 [Mesorhizobium sp. M0293]|uniref:hypothetical protein n=1 Tax=Mesorhizobium sp. M0293 TaxID=2956930 RepID=UPI00333510BD
MTDPAAIAAADRFMRGSAADIVDADYVVMPRLVPDVESVSPLPRAIVMPPIEGMDMLRKPEAPAERPTASRGGPIFWIAGLGAALAAFWVSGGHALVRQAPFLSGAPAPALLFRVSRHASTPLGRTPRCSSMARPPMTGQNRRNCRRSKSG